jgi:putative ABC transport system permease protein
MRTSDLLRIALVALWQQKIRSLLTLAGVVIGTFSLAVSLSLGRGFEAEVMRQLDRRDQLKQIVVWRHSEVKESDIPPEKLYIQGDMDELKRARLRKSIIRRYNQRPDAPRRTVYLTEDRIDELRNLEHVRAVRPFVIERYHVQFDHFDKMARGVGVAWDDVQFQNRLVAGEPFASNQGRNILVSEYLLYQLGITSDKDVRDAVGKTIRLQYRPDEPGWLANLDGLGVNLPGTPVDEARLLEKIFKNLPGLQDRLDLTADEQKTLKHMQSRVSAAGGPSDILLLGYSRMRIELGGIAAGGFVSPLHVLPVLFLKPEPRSVSLEFTIQGVLREYTDDDDGIGLTTVMLSKNADLFLPLDTAAELYLPRNREFGYDAAIVQVDDESHVKEVSARIKTMGLKEYSLGDWASRMRTSTTLVVYVTSFLAIVALLVASMGITNIMIMSVLERRRDIGIMKAVGARDLQILSLYLIEGTLLGALGGAIGMTLSWLLSFPGDSLARRLLAEGNDVPLKGPLFIFPLWLVLGVPLFACLVTTLAAAYPARRAARIDPIAALKHE